MNQQYLLTKQQLIVLCQKYELELITGKPKPLSDIVDEFLNKKDSMSNAERPPLGLKPQFIWIEARVREITEAMDRYMVAERAIPNEWLNELSQHNKFLNNDPFSKTTNPIKDYEITEIECYGGEVRRLVDGLYRIYDDGVGFELGYLLNRGDAKIKSVRRVSDNLVFSIGEQIGTREGNYYANGVIEELILYNEKDIYVVLKDNKGLLPLKYLVKKKQSLFTTSDGKDIYANDDYWYADVKENSPILPIHYNATDGGYYGEGYAKRTFSTKEKATEFIVMNKACLSINDVESAVMPTSVAHWGKEKFGGLNISKLKELASSKINNQ